MIDQQLIDSSARHLLVRLDNIRVSSLEGLYFLDQVLQEETLIKLRDYLDRATDPSRKGIWQSVPGQDAAFRRKISWDFDSVIEELHDIFHLATPKINDIAPGIHKNFWGISIWRDLPGYHMGWHTDNPDIDVSLQIYLYTQLGLGTVFGSDDVPVLIPSHHNSGYLVMKSGDKKLPHRTQSVVPQDTVRYSLYAVWSRFPKHATDT